MRIAILNYLTQFFVLDTFRNFSFKSFSTAGVGKTFWKTLAGEQHQWNSTHLRSWLLSPGYGHDSTITFSYMEYSDASVVRFFI